MKTLPNLASPDAPQGGEDDFVVLETVGTPRDFAAEGFEPRDHLELGQMLGAIDVERGAKVSGSRFYFLTGVGAQLELALTQLAMSKAAAWGFTPMIPPALVKPSARWRAPASSARPPTTSTTWRRTTSTSSAPPRCRWRRTTPTRSSTLASLPQRYAAFSPCFRREAGSYGKDTRGIFRVHWFDKVEMFVYTTLEEAAAEHQRILGWEKAWLDAARAAVPRHRRRLGRPGPLGDPQVRLRGLDPDAGQVPRGLLGVQLHRVPEPPPRHPGAR